MSEPYTISELAKAVDVPTTTLRYYERVGLLQPASRSHGNYRLYTDQSLQRLRFIRAAQAIGFTLQDVKMLLNLESSESQSCDEVQTIIQERLAEIDAQLKNLRHVQQVLKKSLQKCRKSQPSGHCYVIESLQQ